MKLSKIYNSLINEVLTKKDLNALKLANKSTYPKIPTDKIFFNEVPDIETILKITKNAFEDIEKRNSKGFKKETVNVKLIVPTQLNVAVDNLKSTDKVDVNTNAELVKYNQFYFIIDGHHRISNAILNGLDEITAFVYHEKNINENVLIEDYPKSFNMEHFKSLTTFNQRIDYCERELTRISSGSSRIVYKIDDEKVLKLAKNKKGLAQNEVEADYGQHTYFNNLLAKIFDFHPEFLWVEMELAKKVNNSDFERLAECKIKDMYEYLSNFWSNQKGKQILYRQPKELVEYLNENHFTSLIMDFISNVGNGPGDFGKLNSYGIVKRNGEDDLVIIDFGLTGEVYDSYYS
jgi:hypothetical protein